jgi:AcrR family transcriptional regulator
MLDTLEGLLVTKSLRNVSIADVCREANIPRSTFYRRYPNLQAMFAALFEECVNEMRAGGGPWLLGESKRFAPSLEAFYLAFMRHANFWFRLRIEGRYEHPQLQGMYDEMMDEWDAAVAARITESYPWVDSPTKTAQLMNAMGESLLFKNIPDGQTLNSEAFNAVFELAYRGYCSFLQIEMWTEKRLGSPTMETAE